MGGEGPHGRKCLLGKNLSLTAATPFIVGIINVSPSTTTTTTTGLIGKMKIRP